MCLFDESSKVEKRLTVGIHGRPELRPEEKAKFLGAFRERVMKVLTKVQVAKRNIQPEIEEALKDPRSTRLLLAGDIKYDHRAKYITLARKYNKPYTMVNNPNKKGNIGLAVVSDEAVDIEDIYVNE